MAAADVDAADAYRGRQTARQGSETGVRAGRLGMRIHPLIVGQAGVATAHLPGRAFTPPIT